MSAESIAVMFSQSSRDFEVLLVSAGIMIEGWYIEVTASRVNDTIPI